jgi:hypothetical protein
MSEYFNHVSRRQLIETTRALLIFCRSHDRSTGLGPIEDCLMGLDKNNFPGAFKCFKRVPFGGMGTFPDWIPPVKFPNENPEYVSVVFTALYREWARLMTVAAGEKRNDNRRTRLYLLRLLRRKFLG